MNNAEAWRPYNEYTNIASSNCRRLAYAAAAFAWVLRSTEETAPSTLEETFGAPLQLALAFLVIFFVADVLQYAVAGELHRRWARHEEERLHDENGTIEGEYSLPPSVDRWALRLYWFKICVALLAGACIGASLWY